MYRNSEEELEQLRPGSRTAMRITVLGGIALAMFVVIFFRLWYLQVLSGDQYVKEANDNRIREVREPAPRGAILDHDGNVMVDNKLAMVLEINPTDLPSHPAQRADELKRLSHITGIPQHGIRRALKQGFIRASNAPVTLKQKLDQDQIFYLREHQVSFPGVSVQREFIRRYHDGALAAQLLGNVGEVNTEQLKEPRYNGLKQGDRIGQAGVEYEYDRFLRGHPGTDRVQVNALGQPKGQLRGTPATPGNNLRLTIYPGVQATGEAALDSFGLPGAFVAMDIKTGAIIAMGSNPTFDPSIFTRPLSKNQYKQLNSKAAEAPLTNRAIQGAYPTGSVFKPITATAALEDGIKVDGAPFTPNTTIVDTGTYKVDVLTLHNANNAIYGPLQLPSALKVSSDIFFYRLGYAARAKGTHGPIQDWARDYSLGEQTGIDLPGEAGGLIPTPAWRNRLYRKKLTDRPWTAGDNINLSVGQGDLQTDPLQMAVAYGALGNGGDVVRPHIADRVEDVSGRVLSEVHPEPRRHLDIAPANRDAILSGLHAAAMEQGGTSYKVFGNFPIQVAGKTGTAERAPHPDQSWYIVLAPYPNPQVVVAVTIERGGFGVDTAAPVAMRILADYFNVKPSAPVANAVEAGQNGRGAE